MNLIEMGKKAQSAARLLAVTTSDTRNAALAACARALLDSKAAILEQNALDLAAGKEAGLSDAMLDRLALTEERIAGMADGMLNVYTLPDPLGVTLERRELSSGILLEKVSVPIGVIAVVYESRPNVTADSAALCLKSGNAVILRGGKEAIHSNMAIAGALREAVASAGLPEDCIQLVTDTTRESANALMKLNGYVDVLIPRGGRGLIRAVVENATVPVIETGAGTCHIYVDKDADLDMAAKILFNAKASRPSVCNACECVLIHKDVAGRFLPKADALLEQKNVEIRGDERVRAILPSAVPAADEDWGKEYNDYILAAKVVDSMDEALEHIYRYGTKHSEAIVTENLEAAERFLNEVDAAAVYHNASTRFTDGGEFGMGAEIGISTQKLHARGPLGLRELTSMKYKLHGKGQVR